MTTKQKSSFFRREDAKSAPAQRSKTAAAEKPKFERPKANKPAFERPKFDRPKTDKPAFERPKFDRPKGDKPVFEKPKFDRPRVAKPKTDKPTAPRSTASKFTDETPVITKPVGERKPTVSKKAAAAAAETTPIKDDGMVRLNRFVAQSGVCSRREADQLIAAGRVAVNGQVITELGSKVDADKDTVTYDGKPLKGERLIYILMNKSKDHVTTVEDPHAERTVIDLLRGKVRERVYPIGRLDKNTTGVLLLTNDGDLTRELTHPSFEKRKIYHVFLDKPVEEEHLRALTTGIELEDGLMTADQASYVEKNRKEVGIEIHSGRNRIVRRMFEHFGYKVNKLDRVYFAGFTKEGLRRGFWRELTAPEILKLKSGKYR